MRHSTEGPPEYRSPVQPCERVPGLTVRKIASQRQRSGGPRFFNPTPQTMLYEWGGEYIDWLESQRTSQTDKFGSRPS
ncbi:conserved hypothetical protein [Pseudoclavibacter sp. 8L]|nr:conserved hypothetical protein [Pseudoclavibacter sp. 8L]